MKQIFFNAFLIIILNFSFLAQPGMITPQQPIEKEYTWPLNEENYKWSFSWGAFNELDSSVESADANLDQQITSIYN